MGQTEKNNPFLDGALDPVLEQLEQQRLFIKRKYFHPLTALFILAGIFLVMYLTRQNIKILLAPAILSFLGGIVYTALAQKPLSEYKNAYKSEVIEGLIDRIHPGLSYQPSLCIPESRFMASGLFLKTPDRYRGEDMVSGMVGKTQLTFSEIRAQYKTETTDSRGNRHTQWHDIFRGIFIIADFNKPFKTRTLVLPDTAEKIFGSLFGNTLQKWNKGRGDLIKLENVEFEKEFVVYGQDQVESRYILTPDLMERILNFRHKTGKPVYISFLDNSMFVALSQTRDLFEPSMGRSLLDTAPLESYYEILKLVIGIVEDFNLNTRIWGKA
ncbi:MAG TPA: DUF3137 domain-containing protein [Candidatus Mcinerneyibacteriales bacterium]|nr:DUF3137 domain-containing protein [Candidatus Mcinerneyibacteriales bacterium]